MAFHHLGFGSSRDSYIRWCCVISRNVVILTILYILILLKTFSLFYMRSCLSLSYFLFFHFIYDSSHSLYSRIKLKLIIHYPTYFTDRVSNVIRSVLMMLYCSLSCNTHYTAVAQRQRAGLITPRSLDRNGLPVFSYSCALQKRIVNASDFKQASKHTIHRCGAEV